MEGLSDSLSHMQWDERTALMLASDGGHLDVVRELLEAQADVNVQDEVCIVSTDSWVYKYVHNVCHQVLERYMKFASVGD